MFSASGFPPFTPVWALYDSAFYLIGCTPYLDELSSSRFVQLVCGAGCWVPWVMMSKTQLRVQKVLV